MFSFYIQKSLSLLQPRHPSWWTSSPLPGEFQKKLLQFGRIDIRKQGRQYTHDALRPDMAFLREIALQASFAQYSRSFILIMGPLWSKSRLRSYKGLFWKSGLDITYVREREIDFGVQSFFLGVIQVDRNNYKQVLEAPFSLGHPALYFASSLDIDTLSERLFSKMPQFVFGPAALFFQMPLVVSNLLDIDEAVFQVGVDNGSEPCPELRVYTSVKTTSIWEEILEKELAGIRQGTPPAPS